MDRQRRRPSIKQIAYVADLSTATVDRVLNNRPGVRDVTRRKVEDAIEALGERDAAPPTPDITALRFAFILNAPELSTTAYRSLIPRIASQMKLRVRPEVMIFPPGKTVEAADTMFRLAKRFDGIVLMARSSAAIIEQINATVETGTEVVCITNDFPGSARLCYVGMDQMVAGRLAARLIAMRGNSEAQRVALHVGRNSRCEEEREMGFRSMLRKLNFTGQIIDIPTRTGSNEEATELLTSLLDTGETLDSVYSPSSGVFGLTEAAKALAPASRPFIIGHELYDPLKMLLKADLVGALLAADNRDLITIALQTIAGKHAGAKTNSSMFLPAHLILKENVDALHWF